MAMNFRFDFKSYAGKTLKGVDLEFTALVQNDAKSAGWPTNVVSKLKVVITNSKLTIVYPSEFAEEIDELEYGNRSSSPRPVFRRFIAKHEGAITQRIAEMSVNYLVEQDIIP
jgi:hypothetical protein